MKERRALGAILCIIGAALGIFGTIYLFMNWYFPSMSFEAAEPGCEILLKYIFPALSDVGIIAGVMYAVSAYGFIVGTSWASTLAVIAMILALPATWFINVPFMAADQPPIFFPLFIPNLIMFFFLMLGVRRTSLRRTLLSMFTGVAFIMCMMNGIASWSRIITVGAPLFVLVQRLNWVAMIGWGVVTAGIILQPKGWMRVLALGAGLLEIIVGFPLGFATAGTLGRFSLFLLAPILSTVLVLLFLSRRVWKRLTEPKPTEEPIEMTV
jgi:hypothetical protein